jgi:hypothetical protein
MPPFPSGFSPGTSNFDLHIPFPQSQKTRLPRNRVECESLPVSRHARFRPCHRRSLLRHHISPCRVDTHEAELRMPRSHVKQRRTRSAKRSHASARSVLSHTTPQIMSSVVHGLHQDCTHNPAEKFPLDGAAVERGFLWVLSMSVRSRDLRAVAKPYSSCSAALYGRQASQHFN